MPADLRKLNSVSALKNQICCYKESFLHSLQIIYHLLTESEVITGKSQTEALMYSPSDSEVNTSRPRSEISL